MSNVINDIEQATKTILQSITTYKRVLEYEPQNIEAFPAITMFFDGFGQSDKTTSRKQRTWRWKLLIYTPLRGTTDNDLKLSQSDMKNLLFETLNTLASNPSLNDTCLWHDVTTGNVFVVEQNNRPHLLLECEMEVTTEHLY